MTSKLVFEANGAQITFAPAPVRKEDGSTSTSLSWPFLQICDALTDEDVAAAEPHAQEVAEILNRHHPQGHLYRQAASDVLAERQRQIDEEGYTSERDDGYKSDQLARAAACYAVGFNRWVRSHMWPWDPKSYKPSNDQRQNLVRAGALILAEIERLDRAEQAEQEGAA